MDDLISRQAAIDACEHHKTEGLVCKNAAIAMCVDSIMALPSAQPERTWHPVTEPPNHHSDVIVRGVEAIGNVIGELGR